MKIKNLAFFGIMAAILGVNGAARADSTTIIASQAYVDAKDLLKQDQDRRIQTTYSAYNESDVNEQKKDYPSMYTLDQAISSINTELNNIDVSGDISDAIDELDSSQTADSGYVITGITEEDGKLTAKTQTQISNSHVADGAAITTNKMGALTNYQIASSDADVAATDTLNVALGKLAKRSKLNKDEIAALKIKIEDAGSSEFLDAYNAWIESGRKYTGDEWTALQTLMSANGFTDVDNVVADYQKSHQDLIPRNRNIQKGVLYMEGTGIENLTVSADPSAEKSWTTYAGRNNNIKTLETAKAMDQYVPTMAAVESRVLAAIETAVNDAGSNVNSADTNALDSDWDTHTDYLTQVASVRGMVETNGNNGTGLATNSNGTVTIGNGSDTKVPSTKYVAETFKALTGKNADGATGVSGGAAADTNKEGQAVVAVSQTNGQVTATLGTVGSKGITDGAVTTAKIDSKAVTAAKIADNTITADQIASNAVETDEIKNGAVTNAKIKEHSLEYKDTMKYALSNVDTTGGEAHERCTLKSPCTLTMIWSNDKPVYEWTNMDTEDTPALL